MQEQFVKICNPTSARNMQFEPYIEGDNGYCISNLGQTKYFKQGKEYHVPYERNKDGHITVYLHSTPFELDKLVANAFLPPTHLMHLNHIDGKNDNNSSNNLEWCERTYYHKRLNCSCWISGFTTPSNTTKLQNLVHYYICNDCSLNEIELKSEPLTNEWVKYTPLHG